MKDLEFLKGREIEFMFINQTIVPSFFHNLPHHRLIPEFTYITSFPVQNAQSNTLLP
jgi:hypothetical protein